MKILLINDYSTPGGGAEILTLSLLHGLRSKGHDVRFFSSSVKTSSGKKFSDYECFGTQSRLRTLSQTANFSAYCRLKSVLRRFQPDVVHVHMFMTQISPFILPLLRDVPSLYHVNLYEAICPLATKCLPDGTACHFHAGWICHQTGCLPLRAMPSQMLRLHLFPRWRSSFDLFVAASPVVKRFLAEEGIDPVEVIPNGVGITPKRPPLREPPTISFAGHLIPRKGVDVLIAAFAKVATKLPEAKLLIAGHGPEKDKLLHRIRSSSVSQNVQMLGWVPKEDLEDQLKSAWVHATPSIWEEPFGITTLEAMMRGTAVVASRVGAQSDCIQEGINGLLVPPNDPDSLAEALLRILSDRELAESMGNQGRDIALNHFSDSLFIDRFEDVYHRLVRSMHDRSDSLA